METTYSLAEQNFNVMDAEPAPTQGMMNPTSFRIAQIENNTNCNWRCWFCQNAHYDVPKTQYMDLDFFRHILREIRSVYTPRELNVISFSVYNEPTLDPTFKEKLQIMTDMGFNYWFLSNGSGMTKELVDFLIEYPQNIYDVRLNIPTMDEDDWKAITGTTVKMMYKQYYELCYFFERTDRLNFPITVMVNGDGSDSHKKTFLSVYEKFKRFNNLHVSMTGLVDRAEMLKGVKTDKQSMPHSSVDYKGKTLTCGMNYFNNLYFGIEGNVYFCCHDYFQKYSFGSVKDKPLKELIQSDERATQMARFNDDFCSKCSQAIIA
jgi:radical SAM protein with 4Fe4S-binding SPASM domain|tara:strand:- start:4586 stop:5545 length:960 start_codon:yes stop_codon:yes gene_type:complete